MKKRILFIHNWMVCGGIERVLLSLLNRFDYSKFEVELLLLHKEGEFLEYLPSEVKVKDLYSNHSSFLEKINFNLLSRLGIDWGYRFTMCWKTANKYDVIISFTGGEPLKYHTYITFKSQKNISWVHTDLLNLHHTLSRFFTEEQEKKAYVEMDKIVFVSNDAKKQFEKLYSDIITSKEVILNPIEKELIVQYRKEYKSYYSDRCFNIVSVGRLSGEKAFDRLIGLAKRLKNNGYNFKINLVGDGGERNKLEKLIVDNHLEENVFLLGFINPPYEIMSNSDLFVLTSIVEGFAMVIGEAFCLGLPIVSTKTTGPIELIDNDKYGILTEHDDESIFQAVKKMIDDDSLRNYYHKKSLERAEILDIDAVMSKVYSIL